MEKLHGMISALSAALLLCVSCTPETTLQDSLPPIWPDYVGVTIPAGIAPLNFGLKGDFDRVYVIVRGSREGELTLRGSRADFPIGKWHSLTEKNAGGDLSFTVFASKDGGWLQWHPFTVHVSEDPLTDYGVVYRKIAPGYETYSKIGNYQRNIHNFDEDAIIESTLTPGQCVNCHTSNATDPAQYTFHLRGQYGGTFFHTADGDNWVTTKTDKTVSNSVYPYWHPSGNYCACSNNHIHQSFWTGRDRLIEVWDDVSDISVVDVRSFEVISSPLVHTGWYETYPAFSPDGRTLYYCTAYPYPVPGQAQDVRYDLCSIDFDPENARFGTTVDTLIKASSRGRSVTFPRPSYDGRFILYSEADFGCFPIDHKESDLYLYDIQTKKSHPLEAANSDFAESYHNWSSDSKWILFSTRRDDGLYSHLYICHINEDGTADRPFLLPQKNPLKYYSESLYSFNVPDFTKYKVKFDPHGTWRDIRSEKRIKATDKKEEYRIHGTVQDTSLNGVRIFLVTSGYEDAAHVDSVEIAGGKFEFRGTEVRMADLRVDYHHRENVQNLIVATEPGDIFVEIGRPSSSRGTPMNDSLQVWKELTAKYNYEMSVLYSEKRPETEKDSLKERYRAQSYAIFDTFGPDSPVMKFFRKLYP